MSITAALLDGVDPADVTRCVLAYPVAGTTSRITEFRDVLAAVAPNAVHDVIDS